MKESKLIEMQNKIKSLTNVIQQLINEITHLRELSIGTLEAVKLMPGYQDAIDTLKKQMEESIKERKKAEQNGAIEQDTK
jgi:spore maturation protein CgeB